MNVKSKKTKKQVNSVINVLFTEEINKKMEAIEKELKASTWRELETNGKFAKNDKLSFISDEMLIVGCDIGSEIHYIRAIDTRGREFSREAYAFSNSAEGFENARVWMLNLAAENDKKQIVLGLEPTGHYWFALAVWMVSKGGSVVQVNPYAVKQSKEIEDNSQLKDDRKDPKLIANLVKDGIRHRDTPITAYEQNNGTAQLYEASVKTLLSTYKKDFSYLSTTEMIHYDEYKELVNQYLKYKDMFYPFKIK